MHKNPPRRVLFLSAHNTQRRKGAFGRRLVWNRPHSPLRIAIFSTMDYTARQDVRKK